MLRWVVATCLRALADRIGGEEEPLDLELEEAERALDEAVQVERLRRVIREEATRSASADYRTRLVEDIRQRAREGT